MKTHYVDLRTPINVKQLHLAIGNFDGVHLGHKQIIKKLVNESHDNGKASGILSFKPHPRQYFSKDLNRYQIIGDEKKQQILSNLDIDNLFLLNFDESIANLSPSDFIIKIIVQKLQVRKLIVGYDFRFGKDRKGDIFLLKDHASIHGFDLVVIDPIKEKSTNQVYSSSFIRDSIKEGSVEEANKMLGYFWTMEGEVVHGDKKAREMNFPTANILPHQQIYPLKGVYAIRTSINQKNFNGIANFGERPTVNGKKVLLEVNIFDFNKNIYGKYLTVEFLTFIRGEKKFDSFSLLAKQIKKDIQIAKDYHLNK